MLGAGVPSELHVRCAPQERNYYSEASKEPVTVVEAGCADGRCVADILSDGAIRVLPREAGHAALTVRACASDSRVHSATFELEVAEMRLDVVFDPRASRGAADGVAARAKVT